MTKSFSPDLGTRLGTEMNPGQTRVEPPHSLELVSGVDRTWQHGSIFRLRGKELRVGRVRRLTPADPLNDIVIGADTISRRHALLTSKGDQWSCRDDGSTGGTFVNDVRVEGAEVPVSVGDRIRFGSRVTVLCRSANETRDALVRDLPAPLSRLESALNSSAERVKRASTLFHEMDRVLRFLVACTLAVLRRDAATDPLLRSNVGKVLSRPEYAVLTQRRGLTTGAWRSAFLQLAKLLKEGTSMVPTALKLSAAEVRGMEDVIKLRNLWAHGHVPTERELEEADPDLEHLVSGLLGAFAHFTGMPLVSVSRSENLVEGYRYGLHVIRGIGRARFEEYECPARLLSRWCYLFDSVGDPESQSPLLLAPLVAAEETREGHRVVFAERIDLGPSEHSVELLSAEGLAAPVHLPVPWLPEVAWLYESIAASGVPSE